MSGANFLTSLTYGIYKASRTANRRARKDNIRRYNQAVRHKQLLVNANAKQHALDMTLESEKQRELLTSIIKYSIQKPILLDWNSFKKEDVFSVPAPERMKEEAIPPEINERKFRPAFWLIGRFIKSIREKAILLAQDRLDQAKQDRLDKIDVIRLINEKNQKDFESSLVSWDLEKEQFIRLQNEHNDSIERLKISFKHGEKEAVEFYFDALLDQFDLPKDLYSKWDIQYDPASESLTINYDLPEINIIPTLKKMRYFVTKKEFTETFLNDKDLNKIYNELLAQLSLRITSDLYVSDLNDQLKSIVFNGITNSASKTDGNKFSKRFMSLQSYKEAFLNISFKNVESKKVFLELNGVISRYGL